MKILIFLIVGIIIGAVAIYLAQKEKLARLDEAEMQLKKMRDDFTKAEEEHDQRLKEAISSLQKDYRLRNDQQVAQIETEYQAKLDALQAKLDAQASASIPAPDLEVSASSTPTAASADIFEEPIFETGTEETEMFSSPTPTASSADIFEEPIFETGTEETEIFSSPTSTASSADIFEEPIFETDTEETEMFSSPTSTASSADFFEESIFETGTEETEILSTPSPETIAISPSPTARPASVSSFRASVSLQDLCQKIYNKDSEIRLVATEAIAQEIQGNTAASLRALPTLTTLTHDIDARVRRAAVIALGQIKSDQVIPLLKKSLRDSDQEVVVAASEALLRYKNYPAAATVKPVAKPPNMSASED